MPPASVKTVKRALDLAGALCGLALTLPAYPLIAAAIKLESRGPIFYRQRRALGIKTSEGNKIVFSEFGMFKFRSMAQDAEAKSGAVLSAPNDPRVTRVGKILRATRIDELPQFLNVLRGEMSLIGPRPERPELLDTLTLAIPFFEERLRDVKPGITGLAQIRLTYSGGIPPGSELEPFKDVLQNPYDFEEAEGAMADNLRAKLAYDLAYAACLEHLSTYLRTELEVIIKTPWVMLRGTKY